MAPNIHLLVRDIGSTISGVEQAPKTFSSWDNCMQKNYCKYPAIAGIVIGSLVALSILFCVLKCCGCMLSCCSCCSRSPRRMKNQDVSYPTPYQPPPHNAWSQPSPHAPPTYGNAPPQYAQFDVSKPRNEDALPAMPSWDTATSYKKLEETPPDAAAEKENEGHELGTLNAAGRQRPTLAIKDPAAPPRAGSPMMSPYGHPGARGNGFDSPGGPNGGRGNGYDTPGSGRGNGYDTPGSGRGNGFPNSGGRGGGFESAPLAMPSPSHAFGGDEHYAGGTPGRAYGGEGGNGTPGRGYGDARPYGEGASGGGAGFRAYSPAPRQGGGAPYPNGGGRPQRQQEPNSYFAGAQPGMQSQGGGYDRRREPETWAVV